MADYGFKSGSEGLFLEEKYLTYEEAGLPNPTNSPGALWTWGQNGPQTGFDGTAFGQLGDNSIVHRSSPIQIGALTDWKTISVGYNSAVTIKTDGTLWAWGENFFGNLGTGNTINRSSPIQVGALTHWKQAVATGGSQNLAITNDGYLWGWGYNGNGNIGLGDRNNRSSPTQIGTLTNWSKIGRSHGDHSLVIKTDGTLWAWGLNAFGQVGDNTTTHRSSPVQIGALNNWRDVQGGRFHALAIKTDGTLWAWGLNQVGYLGQNNVVHRSSPIQIGALTNWKLISAGWYHNAAIKTDGTLWTWGLSSNGENGTGDQVHRSSPVQVGSLTNWKEVSSSRFTHVSVKTDGTLWTWGSRTYGIIGQGDQTSRSSPIQIGSLTDWQTAYGGRSAILAKRYTY